MSELPGGELAISEAIGAEVLYNRYGGMLFSFILQFEGDRGRAEELLEEVFVRLHQRVGEAWGSGLSLYCWLQRETRAIILELRGGEVAQERDRYYDRLLTDASKEQQWVFREVYLGGRLQEDLAKEVNQDVGYIAGLLKGALLIIRKNLV